MLREILFRLCPCLHWLFRTTNYAELDTSVGDIVSPRVFGARQFNKGGFDLNDVPDTVASTEYDMGGRGLKIVELPPQLQPRADAYAHGGAGNGQVDLEAPEGQGSHPGDSEHRGEVVRRMADALKGDEEALASLDRGKVTPTQVKLIFDRFANDDLRAICQGIKQCRTMKSVEFGCNSFGDQGVSIICECLRHADQLRSIAIWGNSVGDEGAHSLMDLLSSCPGLVNVVLSNNEITDSGLTSLSLALPSCTALRSLDLSVNAALSDAGVQSLVRALKDEASCSLENLNLNNDSVGNDGAKALATWLAKRPREGASTVTDSGCPLITLDLSYNMVEDTGARALAEGLEKNGKLIELNLSGNLLSDSGAHRLLKTLGKGTDVPGRSILIEEMTTVRA
ncbi:unnamed protein product [Vitrella brassicaformis CCMP3155]|uniref:Uncharacterized protein n=1 Tax=Vitrella brassicaformis (strain CCMP3155) TaxID=1169540 RepID=A0A0G4F1B5_VITBC|nr:unnamed protein product [Vitrella brassicaformis CCMP3155]|mmetsp:Transcript_20170/g.57672  ORF Transcript_20170/g.57672 Transcript_20170/m.57672 type:complete len:396 (-) Transcript_20170:129-1316(-)|eukprot:CEM05169.1 unnamed protein product [Vitrella brassicaformis CCMP3155]